MPVFKKHTERKPKNTWNRNDKTHGIELTKHMECESHLMTFIKR